MTTFTKKALTLIANDLGPLLVKGEKAADAINAMHRTKFDAWDVVTWGGDLFETLPKKSGRSDELEILLDDTFGDKVIGHLYNTGDAGDTLWDALFSFLYLNKRPTNVEALKTALTYLAKKQSPVLKNRKMGPTIRLAMAKYGIEVINPVNNTRNRQAGLIESPKSAKPAKAVKAEPAAVDADGASKALAKAFNKKFQNAE
jgi:hypothetical protein